MQSGALTDRSADSAAAVYSARGLLGRLSWHLRGISQGAGLPGGSMSSLKGLDSEGKEQEEWARCKEGAPWKQSLEIPETVCWGNYQD